MRFREFIERTLYHGTVVDNEPSIRQIGLYGQVGSFQQDSGYDDDTYGQAPEEDDEVVFMADKQGLGSAVNAMVHHIAKKLGKGFHDVTDDDIRNYGLLCVFRDMRGPGDVRGYEEPDVGRRPPDDDERGERYPRGAEPGDYYASAAKPDYMLKGSALLRLLKRYGQWPRNWGERGKSTWMRRYPLFRKEIQGESADELRRQLAMRAEDIDYLVDVWLRWHKAMKARKYWSGRNSEQYEAARKEETALVRVMWSYPEDVRAFVQELAKRQLEGK